MPFGATPSEKRVMGESGQFATLSHVSSRLFSGSAKKGKRKAPPHDATEKYSKAVKNFNFYTEYKLLEKVLKLEN